MENQTIPPKSNAWKSGRIKFHANIGASKKGAKIGAKNH